MSQQLDIWITGIGVISPLGNDPVEIYDRLLHGQSAVAPLTRFDVTPYPCSVAATVTECKSHSKRAGPAMDAVEKPSVRYGMAAIRSALQSAVLQTGPNLKSEQMGLFVGTGFTKWETEALRPSIQAASMDGIFDPSHFARAAMTLTEPQRLLQGLSNRALSFGAAELKAWGINQNYCNTGVGGLQALGEASWVIAEERADVVVADRAASPWQPARG